MNTPYNVFISWSGATSKAVATALRDWLPQVIHAINPWMSSEDIEKGGRWLSDMTGQLKDIKLGILCLTPDNLEAPWILFEAGALSKTVEGTFVCPFLFKLESSQLQGPLAQFQAAKAEKEETRKLLHTINRAIQNLTLTDAQLDKAFNKWWDDLEKALKTIPASAEKARPKRTDRDMLEEILALVRYWDRQLRVQGLEAWRESLLSVFTPPRFTDSSPLPDVVVGSEAGRRILGLRSPGSALAPPPVSPPSVGVPDPPPDVEPITEAHKTPLPPPSVYVPNPPPEVGRTPSKPNTTGHGETKRLRFKPRGK